MEMKNGEKKILIFFCIYISISNANYLMFA